MVSKIWFINIFLLLLAVFFGLKAYGVWSGESMAAKAGKSSEKPVETMKMPDKMFDERQVLPESAYSEVVTKNLFASRRTESPPEKKNPVKQKQNLTPAKRKRLDQLLKKITLYGLVITDDSAKALVTDVIPQPIARRGRAIRKKLNIKQTKWVRVGDSLGDFKVTGIKNDRVLLKAGEEDYDLLLYDKDKVKLRTAMRPKAGPTVVGATAAKAVPPKKTAKGRSPFPQAKKPATPRKMPLANKETLEEALTVRER